MDYSPIEGEATAISKGLQDTKYYTLGSKNLHIATNHQPLVATLGEQSVADVPNRRLAKIKEKMMCWRFEMIYNPGKLQCAADSLSRCRPLHMLYISVDQDCHSDEELKEFLELDLEDSMWPSILSTGQHDVMGFHPQSNSGGWDHIETDGPHQGWDAQLWPRVRQITEGVPQIPP